MALEDLVNGGTLVDGIYVYPTDVIRGAIGDFGRVPKAINWRWEDLANYVRQNGISQKRIRNFRTGDLLGYYMEGGPFEGYEIFCATDSCYIFVDPNPVNPPKKDPPKWEPPFIGSGMIFKPINVENKLSQTEYNFNNLWNSNGNPLRNHHVTESVDCYDYKIDVYDKVLSDDCSELAYSIVFADYFGRGSTDFGGYDDETLTKAMYTQYKNLLLDGQEKFQISGSNVDSIFVIDVPRARFNDILSVGKWKFDIGKFQISGSGAMNTGSFSFSSSVVEFVDEYYQNSNRPVFSDKTFSIYESGSSSEVGLFYPTHGVYVFDANYFGNINVSESVSAKNAYGFYQAISGSSAVTGSNGLRGQGMKYVFADYYFLTAKNYEFNYSNNPTFTSGSDGAFISEMSDEETAYITTVGLYNESKELIAVGKISTPIQKDFTEEASFTIKIQN